MCSVPYTGKAVDKNSLLMAYRQKIPSSTRPYKVLIDRDIFEDYYFINDFLSIEIIIDLNILNTSIRIEVLN